MGWHRLGHPQDALYAKSCPLFTAAATGRRTGQVGRVLLYGALSCGGELSGVYMAETIPAAARAAYCRLLRHIFASRLEVIVVPCGHRALLAEARTVGCRRPHPPLERSGAERGARQFLFFSALLLAGSRESRRANACHVMCHACASHCVFSLRCFFPASKLTPELDFEHESPARACVKDAIGREVRGT